MKDFRPLTAVLALVQGFGQIENAEVSVANLSGPEEGLECVSQLLHKASRDALCPQSFVRVQNRARMQ